jgi:chaperonin GroES
VKIQPMLDRVLVRRNDEPDTSILLTDRKKYQICKVLAVGPGAWRDGVFCKTAVKAGDNVLIPGYGGQNPDHEFEDGSFLIQEGDIGAIVA